VRGGRGTCQDRAKKNIRCDGRDFWAGCLAAYRFIPAKRTWQFLTLGRVDLGRLGRLNFGTLCCAQGEEGLGAGRGGTHVIPRLEVINQ
jgi:hypothetical protein